MPHVVIDLQRCALLGCFEDEGKAIWTGDQSYVDYHIVTEAEGLLALTPTERLKLWEAHGLLLPECRTGDDVPLDKLWTQLSKQETDMPVKKRKTPAPQAEPEKRARPRRRAPEPQPEPEPPAKRARRPKIAADTDLRVWKPENGEGSGAFIRRVLLAQEHGDLNPESDQAIADHVRDLYDSNTKRSDVAWNRNRLRREGHQLRSYRDLVKEASF